MAAGWLADGCRNQGLALPCLFTTPPAANEIGVKNPPKNRDGRFRDSDLLPELFETTTQNELLQLLVAQGRA